MGDRKGGRSAMLRRHGRFVIALLVPLGTATTAGGSVAPATGRYIVVLKDSAAPSDLASRVSGLGATVQGLFGSLNGLLVSGSARNLKALRNDPRVAYVVADRPMH